MVQPADDPELAVLGGDVQRRFPCCWARARRIGRVHAQRCQRVRHRREAVRGHREVQIAQITAIAIAIAIAAEAAAADAADGVISLLLIVVAVVVVGGTFFLRLLRGA